MRALKSLLMMVLILPCFLTSKETTRIESSQTEDIPLIPREAFFQAPDHASVKISPNGKRISFVASFEGVLNIWVQDLDGSKEAFPVTKSKDHCFDVYRFGDRYSWAKNNEQLLLLKDVDGDEQSHLIALDIRSGNLRDLTPFDHVQTRLISGSAQYPDEIITAINNRDPKHHDLWAINTRTGALRLIFENSEEFADFFVDHNHQLRIAKKADAEGGYHYFIRNLLDTSWKPFCHFSKEDSRTSRILTFSADNQYLYYLDSTYSNTATLYSGSTDPTNLKRTKIFSDEKSDIIDVIFDPQTKKPRAAISEFLRIQWAVIDPNIQSDLNYLQSISEGDLHLIDTSLDDQQWLVSYSYDNKPAHYYLYDRNKRDASFLFSSNKNLEKLPLTTMEHVVIPSRDGLSLVSYLSLPKQGPQTNLPMVLYVHGGPWDRDHWGYNHAHQLLSSRGYAVLSVNFRGSTGFGKEFVNAANREWSKKMHDDLIDAVNWSIDKGIADPKKIAIAGQSYGGYAALVGLTFTPDVFACGVDLCGISSLQTMLESFPPYWTSILKEWEYRVGGLNEKEFLWSISPLSKIDRICKPLLIVHGKNDPKVKEKESLQIVEAMKKTGLEVNYVCFPDEGHDIIKGKNICHMTAIVEQFLAKNLGGRYQESRDEITKSSAMGKLMDEALQRAVVTQDFRGAVMAVQAGKIHLCKGYGPGNTSQTRFLIGSLTKQFTGIAILRLVQEGKLSLNDTISEILPPIVIDPVWEKITVRQLLRHQSGIPNYGPIDADLTREEPFLPMEVTQTIKNHPLAFPPGTKHQYSNSNYLLLGMIIETITGKSYADYLQTTFFAPLGMTNTGYNPHVKDEDLARGTKTFEGEEKEVFDLGIHASKAFAAGGLYSTVEDLYKWNQAFKDDRFISPKMREEILGTPLIEVFGREFSSTTYNAGFCIMQQPHHIWHSGGIPGFSSMMSYYIDSEDFLVVLSNNCKRREINGHKLSPAISVFDETLLPLFHPEE